MPLGFRIFRWIALAITLLGVGGYLSASATRLYNDVHCHYVGANSGSPWLLAFIGAVIIGVQILNFKYWAVAIDVARFIAIPTGLLMTYLVWYDVWGYGVWPGHHACAEWQGITQSHDFNEEFLLIPDLLAFLLTIIFIVAIIFQLGVDLAALGNARTSRD